MPWKYKTHSITNHECAEIFWHIIWLAGSVFTGVFVVIAVVF